MKRALLALALLALSAPGSAQQAPTISPGGGRAEARVEARTGVASYYAASLHGRRTASGERYDHRGALTAAHKTLPFGTLLRVKSEHNERAVLVRVNDRGPFVKGRVLDLSGAAADRLRMRQRGVHRVRYEIVDPETLPSRQPRPPRKVRHI